jgi:esterase
VSERKGGKVAMSLALNKEFKSLVHKLVVVDMAPKSGKLSEPIPTAIQAYIDLNARLQKQRGASHAHELTTSAKVKKELEGYIKQDDKALVGFLAQNFIFDHHQVGKTNVRLRIDIDSIAKSIDNLAQFPAASTGQIFEGPTLFVYGTLSNYVTQETYPLIEQLFPNVKFCPVPLGHWVHAENPVMFAKHVSAFIHS